MNTETLNQETKVVSTTDNQQETKKKSLLDYAKEFKKKPIIKVLDENLVYGTNMWPKLMKEEIL
jgi:hypothetical protein